MVVVDVDAEAAYLSRSTAQANFSWSKGRQSPDAVLGYTHSGSAIMTAP